MSPRWKGKGSEAKALAEPMSKIISSLQSSLTMSDPKVLLAGCSVLLEVDPEQSELLNRACFGRLINTTQKDKQWHELGLEEAFYLYYTLKCLKIEGNDGIVKTDLELWNYMSSKMENFPEFYKAYSHLKMKNWVERSGLQYGVDYVAYRHHPALVHSEYAVLVLSDRNHNSNGRLRIWSDLYCTIRLCGGVAKTLLALNVQGNGKEIDSPVCLKYFEIEERTISRWIPEQTCEEKDDIKFRSGFPSKIEISEISLLQKVEKTFQKRDFRSPRWKGKGSEAIALAEPMSKIISSLQSSLTMSDAKGRLAGCRVHLEVDPEQSELLNRACFGRLIDTTQKDKQEYELGLEEAFYLCYTLNCLKIEGSDGIVKTNLELWNYMSSKIENYPEFYKAYSHLKMKNWVVTSGLLYGVDFVAYRHHPALVHSEYAVLVLSDRNRNSNGRLRIWSDLYCTIRLSGGVAKTLLALHVQGNGKEINSPMCLKDFEIEERTISRWIPEQSREKKG